MITTPALYVVFFLVVLGWIAMLAAVVYGVLQGVQRYYGTTTSLLRAVSGDDQ